MDNPFQPINTRLSNLETMTLEVLQLLRNAPLSSSIEEQVLNVEDAAKFLGISKQTLYQNINRVPHKKRFGRLYFFKEELLAYLNDGEGTTE